MLLRLKRQIAPAELAAVEATARSLGYECEYLGQKQELVKQRSCRLDRQTWSSSCAPSARATAAAF